jgi:hypothetical protein
MPAKIANPAPQKKETGGKSRKRLGLQFSLPYTSKRHATAASIAWSKHGA